MMGSPVTGVMSKPEYAHVADRTCCSAGYKHINSTGYAENDDRQKPEWHVRHIVREHQVGEYDDTAKGNKKEQRAECSHDCSNPVGATHRAVHNLVLHVAFSA